MKKSLKSLLLITIALLSCSTSYCQNDYATSSFTGEQNTRKDSVFIAYDDLRKVNAKLIELKYEKEINDSLRSMVVNYDKICREQDIRFNDIKKQLTRVKRQRNIAGGIGVCLAVSLVISFIK